MIAAPRVRSEARPIIFLIAAILLSVHVIWQMWLVLAAPYPAHYDYDEGVYAETAAAAAAGHRLYTPVFLSQPPLLIGVLAHTFGLFGRSLVSARAVIVGFSVLWLASLAAIAARGSRPRAALWAVAIAGSAPALAAASHTVQMEGPSEAFAALAVALGLAACGERSVDSIGRGETLRWGMAGVAAGLAVMTKFTAATCLIPLAVALAETRPAVLRGITVRAAALAAGGALAAGATIVWIGSPPAEVWRQTVVFHSAVAGVNAVDPGRTLSLLLAFTAANWLLVVLGLAGLVYGAGVWRAGAAPQRAVAAWLAADLVAVYLWRPVWPHHLVILVTPLAVLAAAAVEGGRRGAPRVRTAVAGILLIAWLAALTATAAASAPETSALLHAAVRQTARSVPAGAWVLSDDPIVPFLAGRDVPPALCDTSEMRMRARWLTAGTLTAALADPRVRGVVLWRGTFRASFPRFVDEASRDFPRRWTAGGGRQILAR